MSYKFIKEIDKTNPHCVSRVTIEVPSNDVVLEEMLQTFEEFLLASGFKFTGELQIVEENTHE